MKSGDPIGGSSRILTISEMWISFVSNGWQIRSATQNYQEVIFQELISDGPDVVMRMLGRLGVRRERPIRSGESRQVSFLDRYDPQLAHRTLNMGNCSRRAPARPLMSELGFKPVNPSRIMSALMDLERIIKDTIRHLMRWLLSLAERL